MTKNLLKLFGGLGLAVIVAGGTPGSAWGQVAPRQVEAQQQQAVAPLLRDPQKVEWNEVPAQIRRALIAEVGPLKIEDIDRGRANGQIVYEFAFKRDDQHIEARVSEDGRFLGYFTPVEGGLRPLHYLDGETEIPLAVLRAITEEIADTSIAHVERQTVRGREVYQISLDKNGRVTQLTVTKEGRILGRDAGARFREPAREQFREPVRDFTRPLDPKWLEDAKKIEFREMPAQVQRMVRRHARGAEVEDVEVGQLDGRRVYQIAYKLDGQHTELRVDEEGRVVQEYRRPE